MSQFLGMAENYSDNSKAQSICHLLASELLQKAANHCSFGEKNINIGVYGCGPGDNDLDALQKYVIPILYNRFPSHIINIYMIDIKPTKWDKMYKLGHNVFIKGIVSDLYYQIFPNNTLDIVVSFSCLHWLDELPLDIEKNNVYCWSLLDDRDKNIISKTLDNRLEQFLSSRTKELKYSGQIVITCDGILKNNAHHFQKPSECISHSLNKLSSNVPDDLFSNFFILTGPRKMVNTKKCIAKIDSIVYDEMDICVKHASCPFWDKYINKIKNSISELDNMKAKIVYANDISSSIMACIIPKIETILSQNNYSFEIIEKLRNNIIKLILNSSGNNYSTSGDVLLFRCYKSNNDLKPNNECEV